MTRRNFPAFRPWAQAGVFCALLLMTILSAVPAFAQSAPAERIVSIGGSVTEIVYALGEEDRLVARDSTSLFPPAAIELPDVGYIRRLSPEGVLSLSPDMVVSLEGAGPPEAVEVLRQSGIRIVEIPDGHDEAAVLAKIIAVGEALGVPEKARTLSDEVAAGFDDLSAAPAQAEAASVLFVLSMANDTIIAAGTETSADGIIRLAGARNAIDSFEGFKPVSAETLIEAAPDAILMMGNTGQSDHGGGVDEVMAHPVLGQTPAGQSGAIVQMDGLMLLGFGPRTPDAATALAEALRIAAAKTR